MSEDNTVVHLYKSARSFPLSSLSQALQLRCFQTAEEHAIKLPDNAYKQQTCPKCCLPWVPGLTVKIRIRLGNPLRESGGLSKRARLRKQRRIARRRSEKTSEAVTKLPQHRKRTLVYECLSCNGVVTTDLGRVIPSTKKVAHEEPGAVKRELNLKSQENKDENSLKKRKAVDTESASSPSTNTNTKKRAKDRKNKSSLKFLLAKNKEKSSGSGKLGLSDFLKPN